MLQRFELAKDHTDTRDQTRFSVKTNGAGRSAPKTRCTTGGRQTTSLGFVKVHVEVAPFLLPLDVDCTAQVL